MKEVELKMLERAKALLEGGEVARVVGWKKGDFCLVVIRGTNRNEIVKITKIVTDKDYGNEYPINDLVCLVSKLDFTAVDSYVEAKKRKEILEDAIDRMYKRISKVRILKEMAKADPELMALLDEYEKIEE